MVGIVAGIELVEALKRNILRGVLEEVDLGKVGIRRRWPFAANTAASVHFWLLSFRWLVYCFVCPVLQSLCSCHLIAEFLSAT